jgi:hypothetical protein
MIQASTEWNAKNAQLAKKPIYVLTIGGQTRVYATHDLAAEQVQGTLPEYRAWLKTPQGASQSIDVLNGSSSIGELECECIDPDGYIRALNGTAVLEGAAATLSVGYPGIAYANFVPLHTYRLYKINPSKGYTSWLFRSRDQQLTAKRTIYCHPENGESLSDSNPWVLQGTPAEIIQAIWLSGLGQDPATIDRAGLVALDSAAEGLFKAVRPFQFQLVQAFEAKQWLETEIFKVCGMYPVVDNAGRLSARAFRPPAAGAVPVFAFTDDNIAVLPEVDRMPITNQIIFKIDHDGSDFRNELVFIEATSVSSYGRSGELSIESQGLQTALGAQWFCEEVAQRLFSRFAGTPAGLKGGAPVLNVQAFLLTMPVWVGDYVAVTHSLMPDLTTGAIGVTDRIYEVIDREPDFAAGRMQYKLLDTGLTGLQPAHKWAPSDRNFIIGTSEVY